MSLDIFKKSLPEKPKPEILIDFREKNSLVPAELVNLGCNIKFMQLEIGDYISNGVVIERKTLSDLQSSIIDKRVFNQIDKLKSQNKSLIIIERSTVWNLHENALRGFILSTVKENIPLIITENEKDSANYIFLLSQDKKGSPFSFRPYKKLQSKEDSAKYILEGFPGVGPVAARKLIEKFGSLKNIFNANEKELEEVLGKKARVFIDLLE